MSKRQPLAALTIGEQIRAWRLDAGLTQEELARDMKVSSITVSRWERNVFAPEAVTLARLLKRFGRAA
jgi:transcriptional regulator with XRE-family HTH domain